MSITWRELKEALDELSDEQLNTDVTIYDGANDEYFAAGMSNKPLSFATAFDVLDDGHPYLKVDHPYI